MTVLGHLTEEFLAPALKIHKKFDFYRFVIEMLV